jgi:hypothetical protein
MTAPTYLAAVTATAERLRIVAERYEHAVLLGAEPIRLRWRQSRTENAVREHLAAVCAALNAGATVEQLVDAGADRATAESLGPLGAWIEWPEDAAAGAAR